MANAHLAWADVCAQANLQVQNFESRLCLSGSGGLYHSSDGLWFQTSGDLVVKLDSTDKEQTILKLKSLAQVKGIQSLYEARDFSYQLIEFGSANDVAQHLTLIEQQQGVLLAQPDLIQLYQASSFSSLAPGFSLSALDSKAYSRGQPLWAHVGDHSLQVSEEVKEKNLQKHIQRVNKRYQNYLQNIGVNELWQRSKGLGVKIAIVDDGFDLANPEFSQLKVHSQFDFESASQEATALAQGAEHGTRVAGIIFSAAQSPNNIQGLAPAAQLIALRQISTQTSQTLLAFNVARLAEADVINCSWNSPRLMQPIADVINDLARNGRHGLGAAVIFAAGNQGQVIAANSIEASIDAAIVVGATNYRGLPLANSNYGASVDVQLLGAKVFSSYPGGEPHAFSSSSLASSIASGLSALLIASDPSITREQLESRLKTFQITK